MNISNQTTITWLKNAVFDYQASVPLSKLYHTMALSQWQNYIHDRLLPYRAKLCNDMSIEFECEQFYMLWLLKEQHSQPVLDLCGDDNV